MDKKGEIKHYVWNSKNNDIEREDYTDNPLIMTGQFKCGVYPCSKMKTIFKSDLFRSSYIQQLYNGEIVYTAEFYP